MIQIALVLLTQSWLLIATGLPAAHAPQDAEAKKALDALQGTWTMEALEVEGQPVPANKLQGTTLVIKGDKYIVKVKDQEFETTFTIDPTRKPKTMDMTFRDGPNKDKVARGIYHFEGDTLKLCRAREPDRDRPTEFGTWPNTGVFLVTWKRQIP